MDATRSPQSVQKISNCSESRRVKISCVLFSEIIFTLISIPETLASGVDKRKLHLSTLIISKQISRDKALNELDSGHAYPSDEMLENDKLYFLKKMDWSNNDLEEYIKNDYE